MVAAVYILLVLIPVLNRATCASCRATSCTRACSIRCRWRRSRRLGVRLDGRLPARAGHRRRPTSRGIAGTDGPMIMFLLVALFVIVGDFIDAVPAIIIFMPIINKLTEVGNINPLHMGVVIITTLVFGLITPPYGLSLLVASKYVGVGFGKAVVRSLPLYVVFLAHDRLHRPLPRRRALAAEARSCRNRSAASRRRPATGYICPDRERMPPCIACRVTCAIRRAPADAEARRRDHRRSTSRTSVAPDALPRALRRVPAPPGARSFRRSDLPPAAQVAFARQFGEVQVHVMAMYHADGYPELYRLSNLDADGKPNGKHPDKGTLAWHTDGSWRRVTGPGDDHLRRGHARASAARPISATCTAPTSG